MVESLCAVRDDRPGKYRLRPGRPLRHRGLLHDASQERLFRTGVPAARIRAVIAQLSADAVEAEPDPARDSTRTRPRKRVACRRMSPRGSLPPGQRQDRERWW